MPPNTTTKPTTEPDPRHDELIARILKVFTLEQFELMVNKFESVSAHGYGDVRVTFDRGHPHTIEPKYYYLFPPPKVYKAE